MKSNVGVPGSTLPGPGLVSRVSLALAVAAYCGFAPAMAEDVAPPAQHALQSEARLHQLVAPIALYPDELVAQVLAASTFPEQVVVADRWLQAHPGLRGEDLAKAVDREPWDPSIKSLTATPAVLGNMDKNLSWTSSLGDAYYNQQQDVMDAVQVMRRRAQQNGRLATTPQQTVANQGTTVVIESATPNTVYIPAYDPWAVYGEPVDAWPGWYAYPGIWFGGPYLSFGLGLGIGFGGGFGWGWNHWGFDWHNRYPMYNHDRYHSGSATFFNRGGYGRGGFGRGGTLGGNHGYMGHPGMNGGRGALRPFGGDAGAARGFGGHATENGGAREGGRGGESGIHSGAFSGIQHGGQTRGFSERGSSSFGGGGGHRSGGGGSRGHR